MFEDFDEAFTENTSATGSITVANTVNTIKLKLTGNTTLTLPNTTDMASGTVRVVTVIVEQDSTGSRTCFSPSGFTAVYNNSSSQPALNTAAGKHHNIYSSSDKRRYEHLHKSIVLRGVR